MIDDETENEIGTPNREADFSRFEAVRLVVTMILLAALIGGLIYVASFSVSPLPGKPGGIVTGQTHDTMKKKKKRHARLSASCSLLGSCPVAPRQDPAPRFHLPTVVERRRPVGSHRRGSSQAELGLPTDRTCNRQSRRSDAVGEDTRRDGGGADCTDTRTHVCASFWSARSGQCRLRRVPGTTQRRGPAERPAEEKGLREYTKKSRRSRVSQAISAPRHIAASTKLYAPERRRTPATAHSVDLKFSPPLGPSHDSSDTLRPSGPSRAFSKQSAANQCSSAAAAQLNIGLLGGPRSH